MFEEQEQLLEREAPATRKPSSGTNYKSPAKVTLKKICMVGANRVGKTSLVRRFVESIFSEKYESTLGVRIHTAKVALPTTKVSFVIWDIHGEEWNRRILPAYYRGMSGYLLFVDGTRRHSLQTAHELADDIEKVVGTVPFILVLSKSDLKDQWEIAPHDIASLSARAYKTIETSAKSGLGVDEAFAAMASATLG